MRSIVDPSLVRRKDCMRFAIDEGDQNTEGPGDDL
jgi:hypothetical protein